MFAGLRPSEILRLDWSMIKFDQGAIAVPRRVARKVRASQLVPIERNLMAWLGPYRELSGPVYLAISRRTRMPRQEKLRG
jgi:integrase